MPVWSNVKAPLLESGDFAGSSPATGTRSKKSYLTSWIKKLKHASVA